jgi:hypothetical protein
MAMDSYIYVLKWRAKHAERHREQNKKYSNQRYYFFKQVKEYYAIDLDFFI